MLWLPATFLALSLITPGPWDWTENTVVTAQTWMTPMSGHRHGTFVTYGSQGLVEANADYRSYDLSLSPTRCGIAVVSPSMLGQIVWIRKADGEWVLCYGVDVVSRVDWWNYVIDYGFIADIPRELMNEWGNDKQGVWGEMFMGLCPPGEFHTPIDYTPSYHVDTIRPVVGYSGWPYPIQQRPVRCNALPVLPHGYLRRE